jgi:hypothetical protein
MDPSELVVTFSITHILAIPNHPYDCSFRLIDESKLNRSRSKAKRQGMELSWKAEVQHRITAVARAIFDSRREMHYSSVITRVGSLRSEAEIADGVASWIALIY